MNETELRALAKRYFIFDLGQSKANLIRKIQLAEGNPGCYASKVGCDQSGCSWFRDCLAETAGIEKAP